MADSFGFLDALNQLGSLSETLQEKESEILSQVRRAEIQLFGAKNAPRLGYELPMFGKMVRNQYSELWRTGSESKLPKDGRTRRATNQAHGWRSRAQCELSRRNSEGSVSQNPSRASDQSRGSICALLSP